MDSSGFTRTAFPVHSGSTMPAEQLSGQEVIYLSFTPCRCVSGQRKPPLHRFKEVFVDNGRNGVFLLYVFVDVCSDIPHILEYGFKTASVKLRVLGGAIAFAVEDTANLSHTLAVGVELKCFLNDMGSFRIYYKSMIFDFVAQRDMATNAMALHG